MNSKALLALSTHRPETVQPAIALMAQYETVILEEPFDPRFADMLDGEISIDAYLKEIDLEYPEFSRQMAEGLRTLHHAGVRLYQVEPFIDKLLQVHERFAAGGRPKDLEKGSSLHQVYVAERDATGALIRFYEVSVRGAFEEVILALKQFARADAKRFALRDQMRSAKLAEILKKKGTYYIEAGQIHFPLWRDLQRRMGHNYPLKIHFLLAPAIKNMGYSPKHLYGPGDLLTLLYRYHPEISNSDCDLYAGRALLYSKLIAKEEIVDSDDPFPHTHDELDVQALLRRLSLTDCRKLYPLVLHASREQGKKIIHKYLHTPHSSDRDGQ